MPLEVRKTNNSQVWHAGQCNGIGNAVIESLQATSMQDRNCTHEKKKASCQRKVKKSPVDLINFPGFYVLMDMHQVKIYDKVYEKYPEVVYECTVCKSFKFKNCLLVEEHIKNSKHLERLKIFYKKNMSRQMPDLTENVATVICIHLDAVYDQVKMRKDELMKRKAICDNINEIVSRKLQGCVVSLYGSSLYGLGTKYSDVNLMLKAETGGDCRIALQFLYSQLKEDPAFQLDIIENGDGTVTRLTFTDIHTQTRCQILPSNMASAQITKLISKYWKIDVRATKLMSLFRYWAKVCGIDQPSRGTLPGYAYYLMVIYYLQQCDPPVLPVLQEELPSYFKDNNIDTLDPGDVLELLRGKWKSNCNESIAILWLKMLKFFGFNFNTKVIQIHQKKPLLRKDKGWNGPLMKYSIADPFVVKKNLSKCINNMKTLSYIEYCLQTTWQYYSVPQTLKGPIFGGIIPDPLKLTSCYCPRNVQFYEKYSHLMKRLINLLMVREESIFRPLDPKRVDNDGNFNDFILEAIQVEREAPALWDKTFPCALAQNLSVCRCIVEESSKADDKNIYAKLVVYRCCAELMINHVLKDTLCYEFTSKTFTNNKPLPLMCKRCEKEGHVTVECPFNQLPPLDHLPETDSYTLTLLDKLCHTFYECYKQGIGEMEKKKKIVSEMEDFLQRQNVDIHLELFGSSLNGFGFRHSDMDICATFNGLNYNDPKVADRAKLIKELHAVLFAFNDITDLVAITTAKVPIIKFTHRSRFDGDISFYNELAKENTSLLYMYSLVDERVPILVLMMKKFASMCGIGHAAKGGLSSYGYTLMVIYYLQRCDPPVVPVLQQLDDGNRKFREKTVEGKNVYFFDSYENLADVWDDQGKNTKTAGELWIDMLKFYTERFDLKHNVIAVNSSQLISKASMSWTTSNISIVDPFDTNHNLGSALSSNMNIYIVKQLRRARSHFCRNIPDDVGRSLRNDDFKLMEFYFDSYSPEEEPPTDRRCLICKTIGHMARTCPEQKSKNGKAIGYKKTDHRKKEKDDRPSHYLENVMERADLNKVSDTHDDVFCSNIPNSKPTVRNDKNLPQNTLSGFIAQQNRSIRFCLPQFPNSPTHMPFQFQYPSSSQFINRGFRNPGPVMSNGASVIQFPSGRARPTNDSFSQSFQPPVAPLVTHAALIPIPVRPSCHNDSSSNTPSTYFNQIPLNTVAALNHLDQHVSCGLSDNHFNQRILNHPNGNKPDFNNSTTNRINQMNSKIKSLEINSLQRKPR